MVTIPDRLLAMPEVQVLLDESGLLVLQKEVRQALYERPSYVALHALSIVQEGEQALYDGSGTTIRIRPGSVGVLRRGLYTITDLLSLTNKGFQTTLVFFDDALLQALLKGYAGKRTYQTSDLTLLASAPYARSWAKRFAETSAADRSQHHVLDLFGSLLRGGGDATVEALTGLLATPRRPLREFMRAHFDKPLTLHDYARLSGRSERSFRRDFRARFGESPKRWLVMQRMGLARELVSAGEQRVSDIAAAVGYTSTSHFIEVYRKQFGVTPGANLGRAT